MYMQLAGPTGWPLKWEAREEENGLNTNKIHVVDNI